MARPKRRANFLTKRLLAAVKVCQDLQLDLNPRSYSAWTYRFSQILTAAKYISLHDAKSPELLSARKWCGWVADEDVW